MKIALLNCDHVNPELRHIGGDYPDIFTAFSKGMKFDNFNVCDREFPQNVKDYEVYIVNGSRMSVYDKKDWIVELKTFVKAIYKENRYYIGICFGHQMLAEALGGKVRKAESGWCVGVHNFDIIHQKSWMNPQLTSYQILMSCQDQVQQLPDDSTILASSEKCPIGLFRVGERMLGIQGHPEFTKAYSKALMEVRIERIGKPIIDEGIASLTKTVDSASIFNWMMNFIRKDF